MRRTGGSSFVSDRLQFHVRIYRSDAVLLHGGWDTVIAAALFWLSPFIVAFLVIRWAVRRRSALGHVPASSCCKQMGWESRSPTGCDTLPSYRRARSARDKGDRQCKEVSTAATKQSRNLSQQKLTIGLDLAIVRAGIACWTNEGK